MITIIAQHLLIVFAAAFKAVADTLADHYDVSVFQKLPAKFWNKSVSSGTAKYLPLTRFKIDAWHIAGSGMIICGCMSWAIHVHQWPWWIELMVSGLEFNLSFDLFYDKVLKKKPRT